MHLKSHLFLNVTILKCFKESCFATERNIFLIFSIWKPEELTPDKTKNQKKIILVS